MKLRLLWPPALACGMSLNAWALVPVVNDPTVTAETAHLQATTNKSLYDLTRRIEELQLEVRELTGKVEEQTHQNAELKKKLGTMYSDFDERMQALEGKVFGGMPPADSGAAPAPAGTSAGSDEPFDFDATPSEPAAAAEPNEPPSAPPQAAAPPPATPAAPPAAPGAPPPATPSAPPAAPAAPPPAAPSTADVAADADYKQAYDDLRNGRTAQSIEEFKAYLGRNPTGPLAGNAQYWLGEAYRVNQDFTGARDAFTNVVNNYANSAKVPDAILKLGYLEVDLHNYDKAREYMTRVTREFPSSNAARLAARKLQTLPNQ